MKQFLFLLSASLLACVSTLAQINHSFVEDGKVWLYNGRSYHWDEDYKEIEWEETYSLEGDTVIGSQQCLKLYLTCNSPYKSYDHAYIGAMYEESEKVYYIAPDNTTSTLLYDFSCDVGDIVKMNWYEIYYPEIVKWDEFELIINDKQLVKYRDKYMTVINWSPIDTFSGEIIDVCPIWIESIGSPIDLLNSTPIWNTGCISKELLTCKLNDQVIYDRDEFWTSAQYIKENEVNFFKGQVATIILPITPDVSKGRYFRLDRVENGKIIFEEELHPQARTPYIIVPNEDFSIDPSTLDLAGLIGDMVKIEGVDFIGLYVSRDIWFQESFTYFLLDTTPDCEDRHDLGLINGFIHVGSLRSYFRVIWRLGRDWKKLEYVLYLADGTTITSTAEPVTYTEGQMATIILPTAPDAGKGKYYRLDRCEGNEIIFEQELQPRARVPYIIVPSEDFSIDPSALDLEGLSNDTVSVDGISFIGTYGREELPDYTGGSFYIDIIDTTPDCTPLLGEGQEVRLFVGALRAWLQVTWDDPIDHGGAKSPEEKKQIVLKDNGTGIEGNEELRIKNEELNAVYDLSGRRIDSSLFTLRSSLKKGIYIEDGRKKAVR